MVVSSERPFGSRWDGEVATIREYDPESGRLVRVFSASDVAEFRRPRGLRFGADGHLYCAAQDEVVAFDFTSGRCLGAIVPDPAAWAGPPPFPTVRPSLTCEE